jgi:hypothetical protein
LLYQFPGALAQDTFSISWKDFATTYAFPPVIIMARLLKKVRTDQSRMILIAPRWPMRAWYASLLDLIVDFPRKLPQWQNQLSQFGILHPDPTRFSLMAWKISGRPSEQRVFQTKLLRQSYSPERPAPGQATTRSGEYLFAGVVSGVWIPILRL